MDFFAQLKQYAEEIEQALDGYLPQQRLPQSVLFDACRYSTLEGGKRLRGSLLLSFYSLFNPNTDGALAFASAVEMIHAYSLVHDDLPCMDDDDMRRGKPSCHKAFDYATAVLTGDALLNRAYEVMLSATEISPERAMYAAGHIARCAGAYGMVGGQIIDLALEKQSEVPQMLHHRMVELKTAKLIEAACVSGCILGGASKEQIEAAQKYALCLGMAFQMRDDVLDIIGSGDKLGKPIGSDTQQGKTTFVTLLGLEQCNLQIEALTSAAISALAVFKNADFQAQLALWGCSREN